MDLARLNLGSVVFDHPDVATGGHTGDGEIAAIGSGNRVGAKAAALIPEKVGLTLQVHAKERGAGGRLAGDEERLAVGRPINGIDGGPAFDGDLAFRLALEREQTNSALDRIKFGKR